MAQSPLFKWQEELAMPEECPPILHPVASDFLLLELRG